MANKFTYQTLKDTVNESVIKITGSFDSTINESNVVRIQANTLYGALDANGALLRTASSKSNTSLSYYNLQLTGLKYYVNMPSNNPGSVEIFWNGGGASAVAQYANSSTIFHLNGAGGYGFTEQIPSISNNSGNTALGASSIGNGDLGIQTQGVTANSSYTLILNLRKDNAMYQRGQFSDPAAFNYGDYGMRP